jgi:hypothetical protein
MFFGPKITETKKKDVSYVIGTIKDDTHNFKSDKNEEKICKFDISCSNMKSLVKQFIELLNTTDKKYIDKKKSNETELVSLNNTLENQEKELYNLLKTTIQNNNHSNLDHIFEIFGNTMKKHESFKKNNNITAKKLETELADIQKNRNSMRENGYDLITPIPCNVNINGYNTEKSTITKIRVYRENSIKSLFEKSSKLIMSVFITVKIKSNDGKDSVEYIKDVNLSDLCVLETCTINNPPVSQVKSELIGGSKKQKNKKKMKGGNMKESNIKESESDSSAYICD